MQRSLSPTLTSGVLLAAIVLASCTTYDPCAGSSSSARCLASQAQFAATREAIDRDAIYAATATQVAITAAAQRAEAQITAEARATAQQDTINQSYAQATAAAAQIALERSYADATSTAMANEARGTATASAAQIALEQSRSYATATAIAHNAAVSSYQLGATATATYLNDKAENERHRRNLDFIGGLFQAALGFILLSLLAVVSAILLVRLFVHVLRWIGLRRKVVTTPDGQTLIIEDNGKSFKPGLQLVPVLDSHDEHAIREMFRDANPLVVEMFLEVMRMEAKARIYMEFARKGSLPDESPSPQPPGVPESLPAPASVPLIQLPSGAHLPMPAETPTFRQIWSSGWRPALDRMLLAYDASGPIYGEMSSLLSVAIAGRQGMGKTTLLRFVAAQARLIGARVVVWDLHADITRDLPGFEAHTSRDAVMRSVRELGNELEKRCTQHLLGALPPILVLSDETNSILGSIEGAPALVERVVFEGRKFNFFAILATKSMPARMFGDQGIRDSMTTHVAFQTSAAIARQIGLDTEIARFAPALPKYVALADLDGPARPVRFPLTEVDDLKLISAPSRATSAASGSGNGSGNGSGAEAATEVAGEVDPEAAARRERVRRLLAQKTPISRIVREEWGATGGNAYQRAANELSEIIAGFVGKEQSDEQ